MSVVLLVVLVAAVSAFLGIGIFSSKQPDTTTINFTDHLTTSVTIIAPTTVTLTRTSTITETILETSTIQGIIPPINDVLISNISLPQYPWGIAVDPFTNKIFSVSQLSNISIINGSNNQIIGNLNLQPYGSDFVVVNPATNLVYSGNYIINGSSDVIVDHFPYDIADVAIDRATDRIFALSRDLSSFGNTSLLVFNATNNSLQTILPLNGSATTLAVNQVTNTVYIPICSGSGDCAPINMIVLNGMTLKTVANFLVDSSEYAGAPFAVAVDSQTDMIYMTDQKLVSINGTTNTVVAQTVMSAYTIQCRGIAVNEKYNEIYVAGWGFGNYGSFFIVNGQNYSLLNAFAGTGQPVGIAFDPTNSEIYVANSQTKSVLALNSTAFVLS